MVQYISKRELERYLKAMAILDIVMISKEDAWLRLFSCSKEEKASFYMFDNGSGDNLLVMFTEIYNEENLTEDDVVKLNSERDAKEVFAELDETF